MIRYQDRSPNPEKESGSRLIVPTRTVKEDRTRHHGRHTGSHQAKYEYKERHLKYSRHANGCVAHIKNFHAGLSRTLNT